MAFELVGDVCLVSLRGELDLVSSERIGVQFATLEGADPDAILVDLGGVTFVDSSGLRLLLLIQQRCAGRGIDLRLQDAGPIVRRVFQVTGLDDAMPWS